MNCKNQVTWLVQHAVNNSRPSALRPAMQKAVSHFLGQAPLLIQRCTAYLAYRAVQIPSLSFILRPIDPTGLFVCRTLSINRVSSSLRHYLDGPSDSCRKSEGILLGCARRLLFAVFSSSLLTGHTPLRYHPPQPSCCIPRVTDAIPALSDSINQLWRVAFVGTSPSSMPCYARSFGHGTSLQRGPARKIPNAPLHSAKCNQNSRPHKYLLV